MGIISTLFKEYNNNEIERNKYIDNIVEKYFIQNFGGDYGDVIYDKDRVDEVIQNIEKVEEYVKKEIATGTIQGKAYFDDDIFKHLDILHSFVSGYLDIPKYYDENLNINGIAFLHARDILKNEMSLFPDLILNSPNNLTGIVNDTLLNFDNGFSMDEQGNIYNQNKECIFNPKDETIKVKELDFVNEKVVTEEGIRIDMPPGFIEDVKDSLHPEFVKDLDRIKDKIPSPPRNEDIVGEVDGIPIYESEKDLISLPVEDLFLGDIFPDMATDPINIEEQFKRYKINLGSFGTCNFKEIPYSELMSLLMWGGGEKGVKPLASSEITDKDISFAPNGTVFYSGNNSTFKTKRAGCKSKTYKTGHVMMYSENNKIGMKKSLIQYLYGFCASIGLFNANIPKLIGFKKFKVFPGLCIGGLLEIAICNWQEKLSSRINSMFQCIPMNLPTDSSQSCFENSTFDYGCSLDNLEQLDSIKSLKYGDRYIITVVPPSVTGNKENACGVFIYDPNKSLANSGYVWRYKNFSGKPFNKADSNKIVDYSDAIEDDYIKDQFMNTSALGVDSITRKMMSLQYAYMKKEALLSLKEVEYSIEEVVRNIIYETMDKLTTGIANYVTMEDLYDMYPPEVPTYPSRRYCEEFLKHFEVLTTRGILEMPDKDKYLKQYVKQTGSGSGGGNGGGTETTVTIMYYDFKNLDSDKYLVPDPNNLSKYDCLMFASGLEANEELVDIYEKNKSYLAMVGGADNFTGVKTLNDFLNKVDPLVKQEYESDVRDNLRYIKGDLDWQEYDPNAYVQVEKRCYYVMGKYNFFGG
ncbi:hypothetical protein [Cetobacterium sp.]|uniref:hypothetical protein n=1 Tax=Cetobacterium sp. TaxID=2071632 RepID=UPI003F34B2AC